MFKFDIFFNWFKFLIGNIRKILVYLYDNIFDMIYVVYFIEKRVYLVRNLGYSILFVFKLECGGD